MIQEKETGQEEKSIRRGLALTIVFSLLISLPHLLLTHLGSGDETRVAGIAAEMTFRNDWLLPRLNGEPFLEYPPLAYDLMSLSYRIFGMNDAAARLPAMLFGTGGMILAFLFALRLKLTPAFAVLAAVILGTSAQYFGNTGKCTVDMQLAFFIGLAVCCFFCYAAASSRPAKAGYLIGAAIGFIGGTLTKGLIGAVLPCAVLGTWLLYRDIRCRKFSFFCYLALAGCVMAALVMVSGWYFYVQRSCGGGAGFEAVVIQNFGRFSGQQGDHVEPFTYYLLKLPMLFQPYLAVLLFGIWHILRRHHGREETDRMLPVIFLLLPFFLLSCAAGKRVVYLLMLALPCALITAIAAKHLAERYGHRLPQALHHPRARVLILLLTGVIFAGGNLIYNFLRESDDLTECFAECRKLQKQGIKLYLATGVERTRGAACFYLGHTLPAAKDKSVRPATGTAFLYRSRKKPFPDAMSFPDDHYLVSGGPAVPASDPDEK